MEETLKELVETLKIMNDKLYHSYGVTVSTCSKNHNEVEEKLDNLLNKIKGEVKHD